MEYQMAKKSGIADLFGGLMGGAVKNIKERKSKLQEAEDEAMGVSGDTESAEGKKRPNQSKKWVE